MVKKSHASVVPEPVDVRVDEGNFEDIKKPDLDSSSILNYIIQDTTTFKDPVVKSDFIVFAKRLSLTNQMKIFFKFESWQDSFDEIDPDGNHPDPTELRKTMDPKTLRHKLAKLQEDRFNRSSRFLHKLWQVLSKAEFDALPHEQLNRALEETLADGVNVKPPDPRKYSVWMFTRGTEVRYETERSFRTCFFAKVRPVRQFDRVLVVFRVEDEKKVLLEKMERSKQQALQSAYESKQLTDASTPAEKARIEREISEKVEKKHEKEMRRIKLQELKGKAVMKTANEKKLDKSMQPGFLYLKLFKDVGELELDMMVPQTEIGLSKLDILLVVVPILIGCLTTIANIVRGKLNFAGSTNTINSVVICAGPLIYGAKAYMSAMAKLERYRADLTTLYRLHNVSNNAGVVSTLLEEAHEMDNVESLLAYYTLFSNGKPMTRKQVDEEAEMKIKQLARDEQFEWDFDVNDALEKLRDFGLVKVHGDRLKDPEGCKYESIPLVEALQRVSQPLQLFGWDVPDDQEWSTCTDYNNETGDILRYRFNRRTGQSVPANGA